VLLNEIVDEFEGETRNMQVTYRGIDVTKNTEVYFIQSKTQM
jgi:hypothetical protein